jgi:N-acetyl-alpha-D-muramate 1-phosphate uridylyltransferase
VVEKLKSFDNTFKGDFNIKNNLVNRDEPKKLNYVYTGLQIIKPDIFSNVTEKIFSMNKVWDNLIERKELFAIESKLNFFHVSTLDIYNKLLKLNLNIS